MPEKIMVPVYDVMNNFINTQVGNNLAATFGLDSPQYKEARAEWEAQHPEQAQRNKAEMARLRREQSGDKRTEGENHMNELTIINHEGSLVIDSREVAEMVGKPHNDLMKNIRSYCTHLIAGDFSLNDFFLESTYQDSIGRTLPCYLLTRKGCDMVANKMTGEKGVRFSAAYIDRFYAMETALANPAPKIMSPAELSLLQAQALVELEKKQSEQEAALQATNKRLDSIGEIIALNPVAWREEARKMIVRIAQALGGNSFIRDVTAEIYQIMLERFSINVKQRLVNKKRRGFDEGLSKSRCDKFSGVDVIEEDKKAIEAYLTIIKEMAIKHGVDKAA